ncbi:carboxypeptidase-like regulatory domain-containing protein [Zavarzinella formosa]|uniref:carboxypeptidase-like regulatory domain-containing protein n=1 Tax=Zavarzinella formosa TaxID=360055 RepID=UPI000312ECF7|nr:carboxypeptidase-like regulatory domain-containing protein [Zavarzinella formosa]
MPVNRLALFGLFAATLGVQAADAVIMLRQGADESVNSVAVRPNNKQAVSVAVKNTSGDKKTFNVILEADGLGKLATTTVTLNNDETKTVEFQPPPAPKVEPKKDIPAPKAEAKKEETPEPPPGVELKSVILSETTGFAFRVRVTDTNGKELATRTFKVEITLPNNLITEPKIELNGSKGIRDLKITMDARKNSLVTEADPVRVSLVFPPQLSLAANPLRSGTYERELKPGATDVSLYASEINLAPLADGFVRFHLDVDGVSRAFTYAPQVRQGVTATATRIDASAVRLLPVDGSKYSLQLTREIRSHEFGSAKVFTPEFYVRPSKATKFLAEVENESPRDSLILKLDRSRTGKFQQSDEIVSYGMPREVRVWLNLAGPAPGLLEIADTVRDRVVSLDTSSIRGRYEMRASIGEKSPREFVAIIVVDDTPPEVGDVQFGVFEKKHLKGTPLPVSLVASDVETTPITRVEFVLAKPGPDGKLPPEAVRVEGTLKDDKWVAQLPLPVAAEKKPTELPPPEKKPETMDVTAVVQNAVGLETMKTVRIELYEKEKKIHGKIVGRVERGGRPQPDVSVLLRDAKGEEKGATKTNAKGEFTFEHLLPGLYRVASAKPDAGAGSRGEVRVEVEVDKTSKPVIPLTRPPFMR